jgi:hypothetical protein
MANQTAGATPRASDSSVVVSRRQVAVQLVLLWLVSALPYLMVLLAELSSPRSWVAFPFLVALNRRVPKQWVAYAYPKEAKEEEEEGRALDAYAAEYPPWHPMRRETRMWRILSPVLTAVTWALPLGSSSHTPPGKQYEWPMAPGYVRFILRRTGYSRSRLSNLVRVFNLVRLCTFASFWVVPWALGWSHESAWSW